jgi:hypothetical protein
MQTHTQLKIFFAGMLIALATLTALAQVTGQGQPAKPSVVGIPPHTNEPAQALLRARLGVDRAERIAVSTPRTNRHGARAMTPSNSASFLPVVTYDARGQYTTSVTLADVNGDGKIDAVVANWASSTVAVLLGHGDGTFEPAVTYDAGGAAWSVAAADVNGDGNPDLLVGNCGPSPAFSCPGAGGSVAVLLGNGDGTFKPAVTYDPGSSTSVLSIALGDVNGDGNSDLLIATCNENSLAGAVGVLLGNGDGTFRPAVTYDPGARCSYSIAVADVNGDGKPDLVVANSDNSISGSNELVGVLIGNGDGTFRPAVTYGSGGEFADSIVVADVNGDHKPDLLVANACADVQCSGNGGNGVLGVLLGNGDGTFQPAVIYDSGGEIAWSVVVADVNADGRPDVVLANRSLHPSTGLGVLLGNGDGTFQPVANYGSGGILTDSVKIADLNGDGRLDMVVANAEMVVANGGVSGEGSVGVLLNNGGAPPTTTSLVSSLNPARTKFAVTYTATVKSQSGGEVTGTVTFQDGSSTVATVPLAGNQSTYTTSYKTTGTHLMVASYSGDLQNTGSTSPSLTESIFNGYASTTGLTSSLNPSIYGQAVTWTATVTSSGSITPTGKVKFTWSGFTIGWATLNSKGVATLTRSNLNADTYPLTAVYTGDAANLGSTSAVLNQVVLETTSSATLTSSPNPSTQGQAVTFTATISSPTVPPKGPVTFTTGKTVLGTAQLSNGKAHFTTSSLTMGSTTVTATYNGDSNIAKSSASVIQTVQ